MTTAASAVLVDFKGVPISAALGVLGMPARTAYFGLLEAGRRRVVRGAERGQPPLRLCVHVRSLYGQVNPRLARRL